MSIILSGRGEIFSKSAFGRDITAIFKQNYYESQAYFVKNFIIFLKFNRFIAVLLNQRQFHKMMTGNMLTLGRGDRSPDPPIFRQMNFAIKFENPSFLKLSPLYGIGD
jgi:hypothetical protein